MTNLEKVVYRAVWRGIQLENIAHIDDVYTNSELAEKITQEVVKELERLDYGTE